MRACVIFNPAARGEKAVRFRERLAALSAQCSLKPTVSAGGGRALAAEAVREGFDTIIAAGGDGTVNEVLNGIGDVPKGFAATRLAVLPLGTINVLARELRIPTSLELAWNVMGAGRERLIDLPCAEFQLSTGAARRYFVQLAGAGLDSRAIAALNWNLKRQVGPLAYVWAGLKVVSRSQPQLVVTVGESSFAGELVIIGNGRFYGGSFAVFPSADLEDGLLEVAVYPKADWLTLLRVGGGWAVGDLNRYARPHLARSERVQIQSLSPVPVELDGENVGLLPASFSVERQKLRVLVP